MSNSRCLRSPFLPTLVLMLCTLPALGQPPDDCPGGAALVTVTVMPDQDTLGVDPNSVEIYLEPGEGKPGRVCWKVEGLGDDETLHLAGKETDDFFPDRERTIRPPRDFANSGRPAKAGTWTYSLWITRGDSDEKLKLTDPEIIVNGGGETGGGGDGGGR